jgi:hypothetical protein
MKKKVFLTELKTDIFSRRDAQDKYLKNAKRINITGLADGLLKIYKATQQRKKYQKYLEKLVEYGWLQRFEDKYNSVCSTYDIDIVYIQPCDEKKPEEIIITFDEIIKSLDEYNDEVSIRFVKSLEKWKQNPN